MREAKLCRNHPGIVDTIERTTAFVIIVAPSYVVIVERFDGDADDVITLLDEERCRSRRIDAAAHPNNDRHIFIINHCIINVVKFLKTLKRR
jgi:hypothetical protein